MAAGAGIGGIFVDQVSLSSITWIGMIGVILAIIAAFILQSRMSAGKQGAQVPSES
jgi:DHA1 family putative efflux transporter-like MFS transporter